MFVKISFVFFSGGSGEHYFVIGYSSILYIHAIYGIKRKEDLPDIKKAFY